jgi:hypothetical protein
MSDGDKFWAIVGMLFLFIFSGLGIYRQAERNRMLAECEKTLPRNQHCELVAVPVTEKDEDNAND